MEMSLHRELKARYGPERGGRSEVTFDAFRVDAVAADGVLVEVQSGALAPLRPKLRRLLQGHRVLVVKPVVLTRRLIRRAGCDGTDLSARISPKRGTLVDVFNDLVGLAGVFPNRNLRVDVVAVEIDEVRISHRRRPGYAVADRRLRSVGASVALRDPDDLWALLPVAVEGNFTTRDLAERLARPLDFAQRVAYCLRRAGEIARVGKKGNLLVYRRVEGTASHRGLESYPAGRGLGEDMVAFRG